MESNTFYYTLSTIPQVLPATTAILAAYMFFRIKRITDYLIGEGQVVLDRYDDSEPQYQLDDKYFHRLRDGVSRRSIPEVKEPIRILKDKEIANGFTLKDKPKGVQHLYCQKFCPTERLKNKLELLTISSIVISSLVIIFSIISLSLTDYIFHQCLQNIFLRINVGLLIFSLLCSILTLLLGVRKTIYEDLDKRDQIVKRNRNLKN